MLNEYFLLKGRQNKYVKKAKVRQKNEEIEPKKAIYRGNSN